MDKLIFSVGWGSWRRSEKQWGKHIQRDRNREREIDKEIERERERGKKREKERQRVCQCSQQPTAAREERACSWLDPPEFCFALHSEIWTRGCRVGYDTK